MVEGLVQLPAAEGRAMGAFMPMGIARGVERAVDQEGGDRPPAAPGQPGDAAAADQQQEPRTEIGESRGVAARHQRLQRLPLDAAGEPLRLDAILDPGIVERDGGRNSGHESVVMDALSL